MTQIKNVYTRKVELEYFKIIYKGGSTDIDMIQVQLGNNYLVEALTGLSSDAVLELPAKDFDDILKNIQKIKKDAEEEKKK